jgi:lysophospholipase L1-like esterase
MHSVMRRVHLALLLSILLSSCADKLPGGTVSPTLTLSPVQTIFYLDPSALSYGVFETDATSVIINVYNSTPKAFRAFGDISIEDGSGITTYKVQSGESTVVHSMPPGGKRVTITSGGQSKFNNELRGVFITKITFDRSTVQIQPSNPRLVIYGDSITVGGNVDYPSAEAWPVLLRKQYSVFVEAHGYRMLHEDASTSVERSEFVSRISSWTPDYIWLAIGTNDYGFEQWSAQEFGKAYATLLDAIHSSNSQALLFAQSPILRASESPNSFGDNLDSYRQQIAVACSARSAWCKFVDGTNSVFPQPIELDKDGVHLTMKSSAKYAKAVLTIIGKSR